MVQLNRIQESNHQSEVPHRHSKSMTNIRPLHVLAVDDNSDSDLESTERKNREVDLDEDEQL